MTLNEAIKHAEEVADRPCFTDDEKRCGEEHRQLAKWLKSLLVLTKRPCEACKYHTEKGCSQWDCIFEEIEEL